MSIWPKVSFNELYLEPSLNGLTRPRRVRGAGYKMVNMGELFAFDRIQNPPMELVPMNEREIEKYSLTPGDLLFARQSLVREGAGKISIVLGTPEITTFEGHLIRVRLDTNKANPLFYFYYFSSPIGKANMQTIVMQVAAAGIRGSELAELSVPYPSSASQNKIAGILSAYDNLIENNLRRIEILEEMARAIYREWFVHFKFPGYENVEIVDSELGEIPEGWETTPMENLVSLERGNIHPQIHQEEVFAHFSFAAHDTEKLPILELGSEIKSNKYAVKEGYILLSKLNPRFPRVWLAYPKSEYRAIASTDFLTLFPKISYTSEFLYCTLESQEFLDRFRALSSGTSTSHQRVKPQDFLLMSSLGVPSQLVLEFSRIVTPIFHLIHNFRSSNVNLGEMRNLLLPRLVSGRIDVSDLDIEISGSIYQTSKNNDAQSTLVQWLDRDDKE